MACGPIWAFSGSGNPCYPELDFSLFHDGIPEREGVPVSISKELLEILVCPLSRAPLVLDGNTLVSTDKETRRRYRIEEGIPDLLIEDSEELDPATWSEIMKKHGK